MKSKSQILQEAREEFNRWEAILTRLSAEQIASPNLPSTWTTKDVVAHLWAWQQRSIARLEAALHDKAPEFPEWPHEFDPEVEEEPDALNAWLYEQYRDKLWTAVYQDWRAGYLRFLELGETIPEEDLLHVGKYPWLEDYPLAFIISASVEHHAEHRGWLVV